MKVWAITFLIGDTAYPNLPWLVTPFKDYGHLTAQQLQFNYTISAARVVVEHTLGLLKGRFRRLRKLDNLDINFCTRNILGACVLHNICINERDFIDNDLTGLNQPNVGQHIDVAIINSCLMPRVSLIW